MGRLIGKLSERQLVEALVAAGYDSSKTRLYTEKLVNRRDRMVMDLGLGDEIPLLRPRGVDKKFSYDPVLEEPVTIDVPGHSQIQAPPGSDCIVHGKLVGGRRAQPPNATHRSAVSYH